MAVVAGHVGVSGEAAPPGLLIDVQVWPLSRLNFSVSAPVEGLRSTAYSDVASQAVSPTVFAMFAFPWPASA